MGVLSQLVSRMDRSLFRMRLYAGLCFGFFLLGQVLVLAKPLYNFVVSDGRGYYAYLPTVIIDHDFNLTNQINEHWDVDFSPDLLNDKTPIGYPRDKYTTGLAVTLLPGFVVAHLISGVLTWLVPGDLFSPDGYSVLYQLFCVLQITLLGFLTLAMSDILVRELWGVSGVATGLAVVLFLVGSHYAYYFFREPVMVHVVSAFWVTAVVFLGFNWSKSGDTKNRNFLLVPMAFSLAMAGICRPTNIFLLPFVVVLVWHHVAVLRSLKMKHLVGIACGAALPIMIQMSVWKGMTGSWFAYAYGDEGFNWLDPYLFSTLFSSLHGLFFWTPLLVLSAVGIGLRLGKTGAAPAGFLLPLVGGAVLLWYLNSAWHCWWFGDAFGGRSFLELTLLFIAGLAFFLDAMTGWSTLKRRALWAYIAVAVLFQYGLMALYIGHKIPRADYLF